MVAKWPGTQLDRKVFTTGPSKAPPIKKHYLYPRATANRICLDTSAIIPRPPRLSTVFWDICQRFRIGDGMATRVDIGIICKLLRLNLIRR
jgi:hypothetical protein